MQDCSDSAGLVWIEIKLSSDYQSYCNGDCGDCGLYPNRGESLVIRLNVELHFQPGAVTHRSVEVLNKFHPSQRGRSSPNACPRIGT